MNYKLIKLINKLIKDEKLININVLGKTRNRKILKIKTNNNNYILKFFTKPMLHKPIEAEKKNLIYFKNKNINRETIERQREIIWLRRRCNLTSL